MDGPKIEWSYLPGRRWLCTITRPEEIARIDAVQRLNAAMNQARVCPDLSHLFPYADQIGLFSGIFGDLA